MDLILLLLSAKVECLQPNEPHYDSTTWAWQAAAELVQHKGVGGVLLIQLPDQLAGTGLRPLIATAVEHPLALRSLRRLMPTEQEGEFGSCWSKLTAALSKLCGGVTVLTAVQARLVHADIAAHNTPTGVALCGILRV